MEIPQTGRNPEEIDLKKLCIQGIKIIIAGILAVAVLSLIALVYEYTGVHVDNPQKDTDYVWLPGQYKANMTEGFSFLFMDANGYNNTKENEEKAQNGIDILLMGSSHVEAVQVASDENMGYLLNQSLPEKNTYSIGMSGHDIYRVMDNLPYALERFSPGEYLVMECYDVKLDKGSMLQILDGSGQRIPSYNEGLVAKMQRIPAVKWIYKELSTWNRLEKKQKRLAGEAAKKEADNTKVAAGDAEIAIDGQENNAGDSKLPEGYYETLLKFLSICRINCDLQGCKPIIFYHPTGMFLQNGYAYFQTEEEYLEAFKRACEENGILFLDMTDVFLEEYEKNHIFPHGFSNTAIATGHLNADGHRMIAEALTKLIEEEEQNHGLK